MALAMLPPPMKVMRGDAVGVEGVFMRGIVAARSFDQLATV
jgi:hypothetical protein